MDGESVKMSLREMEEMVVGHDVEMVIINERYDEFGLMLDHALWVLFLEQVDPEARVWFSDIIGIEHLTGHKIREVKLVNMATYTISDDDRKVFGADEVIGWVFFTDSGHCLVAARGAAGGGWISCDVFPKTEKLQSFINLTSERDWKV